MRTRHTKSLLAVCLVAVAFAAGCASDPKDSVPSDAATSPATTPIPSLSEEDQAASAAESAYREWRSVWDSCLTDPPNTVSSCFDEVSVGTQLQSDYVSLSLSQQDGTYLVGAAKIISIELVSVDLTERVDRPEDPAQGIPEVRTVPKVVFDVCLDRSEYDLVNAAGESQLPPGYARYRRMSVEVVNYNYPDSTQWRVRDAYKDAEEVESCEL